MSRRQPPQEEVCFGEYIKRLRQSRGMPLRKLSALLDLDQSTLSKVERSQRTLPSELLPALARAFGLNEDELRVRYLSDKILLQLRSETLVREVLRVAEERVGLYTP